MCLKVTFLGQAQNLIARRIPIKYQKYHSWNFVFGIPLNHSIQQLDKITLNTLLEEKSIASKN